MASIWRMSFFSFPPRIIFIVFCLYGGFCRTNNLSASRYWDYSRQK
jgi:hypothetical protein